MPLSACAPFVPQPLVYQLGAMVKKKGEYAQTRHDLQLELHCKLQADALRLHAQADET